MNIKSAYTKQFIVLLSLSAMALSVTLNSCGRKDTSEEEEMILYGQPDQYQENDTISINPIPENLGLWINYYQQFDTAFNIKNFKASGVTVHLNGLGRCYNR